MKPYIHICFDHASCIEPFIHLNLYDKIQSAHFSFLLPHMMMVTSLMMGDPTIERVSIPAIRKYDATMDWGKPKPYET